MSGRRARTPTLISPKAQIQAAGQAQAVAGISTGEQTSRQASVWSRFLHLWVLLYFTLLSLVMTWPLALHMTSALVGRIGDNLYFVFLIRWYERAWFELGISPFFHPWMNYPQGWNLATTETSLAMTLLGLPASLLAGPVFGYNVAMLAGFVLSGWAMFFWVRRLTGSTAAALVAGTIYAFLPFRMARFLIGHLNLSGTQWFPLFFMALYDLLRAPLQASLAAFIKERWRTILLAAVMLGLISFTSMYYLYMTLLLSAVFVLAYALLVDRARLFRLDYWKARVTQAVVLGVVSFPLVLGGVLPFLGLESQGGLATRSVGYASMYSASPTDFFLPSTDHFLFGRWVNDHFDRSLWIEATMYIGAVALALAGYAWLRRRENAHLPLMMAGLAVIIVAFVLALGTNLHWNNQPVEVPVPAIFSSLTQRETVPIPLPAYLLFQHLPFYAKMRALMRVGFFVLIFTSLMAGLGAHQLLRRVSLQRVIPVTALLLGLVFFDFYPGPYANFSEVSARPVDAWLAAQPGQGAVAQFPFYQSEDQEQVYNTLVHRKPFIGGFFSANQPEQYLRIRPVLEEFPNDAGAALLRELRVQWVLFDTRQYPDFESVRRNVETHGLVYIDTIGDEAVFEITPAP